MEEPEEFQRGRWVRCAIVVVGRGGSGETARVRVGFGVMKELRLGLGESFGMLLGGCGAEEWRAGVRRRVRVVVYGEDGERVVPLGERSRVFEKSRGPVMELAGEVPGVVGVVMDGVISSEAREEMESLIEFVKFKFWSVSSSSAARC